MDDTATYFTGEDPARFGLLHSDGTAFENRRTVRGGAPSRHLLSVDGGPVLAALYTTPALLAFIAAQVALPVRPCGAQASYSIYRGAGAGLVIHRDVAGCDQALIACLDDNDPLSAAVPALRRGRRT